MKKIWVEIYFLFMISVSFAQLSPGDLSQPHADLDGLKNCTKCHEIGEQVSSEKCLACHSLLNERIQNELGMHARKDHKNCVSCHSDHHGREFNLIWWKDGQENFNHSHTGYTLEGKHQQLDCRKCHRSGNIADPQKLHAQNKDLDVTFLGLGMDCLSCHLNEHRNQLDKHCLTCHEMQSWKPAPGFDHKRTKYPLTGKHKIVPCESCHKKIVDNTNDEDPDYLKYTNLNFTSCGSCHQDTHAGRLGVSCIKCHTTTGWKGIVDQNFDHNSTRFPLIGKHESVGCNKCHNSKLSLKNLKFQQCNHCHKDFHQGQFIHRQQKGACEECHSVQGFHLAKFTIEQHNQSGYTLEGAHLAIPCNMCHQKTYNASYRFKFASTECTVCHSDPHKGEANVYHKSLISSEKDKKCEFCHSVERWDTISFDHSRTRFELTGKHKSTRCGSCHQETEESGLNPVIKLKIGDKKCQDCHRDIHLGQFADRSSPGEEAKYSTRCERCHNPENWEAPGFNHNRDSKFKIEGAHKNISCTKCHLSARIADENVIIYKPMETACSACHSKKDISIGEIKS